MATLVDSVHKSSDLVNDFSCDRCKSKNLETSADFFCERCLKCFCGKCLFQYDKIHHFPYRTVNKWPLSKAMEDLLLKCDIHTNKKLKMFCQDHSQLCCSDCVLFNHRRCTNLALVSGSVKKLSLDMQQLSGKIKTILAELNEVKRMQEACIQSVEGSYSETQLEIIRIATQSSLKKDVENSTRLKDELQQLGKVVQGLQDKRKIEMEFIPGRKCLDKIKESELYVKLKSSIIFKANIDIERYMSKQSSLGKMVDSMQSFTLERNPDPVLTVKRKFLYNVKISNDTITNRIKGMCSLPSGQVIVADYNNHRLKLLGKNYKVSSHCDVSGYPNDICLITSSEVAVTLCGFSVQFMSVSNGQLVNGRKLQLKHAAVGIAHHQGALYITSRTALYHYTLTGTLVKKLYEDTGGQGSVFKCAVSPAGDKIYVTNYIQHMLITLATSGTLISIFTDPELRRPAGVNVTPSGQVLVCGYRSNAVIQVDHEGKKKLATLASWKDGLCCPISVCYNTVTDQIIVEFHDKIMLID